MLKKILIGLGVLIVLLLIGIAMQPAAYHIERSATVSAPAEVVFPFMNDVHRFPAWSPWEKLDPGMTKTFSGPPSGVGSSYAWAGNNKVGEGRMTITQSEPPSHVQYKLEFLKPMESTSTTDFTLKTVPEGTAVTWAMDGTHNFVGKAFALFMNVDAMVGKDFEEGLATLKGLAETEATNQAAAAAAAAAAAPAAPAEGAVPAAAPDAPAATP